ncbi:ferredoxin [Chloroherpeton thalassium ATCC 35110]|uniref:Ferredoxin n=1 Tax=Chloroherpeton thalassium (strain ATCC 35110 / GB-78) TaxID=517418 RepID=B3QVZ1_CHLT3|nr:2Fe-2S iron-sulfur cluster-binding protein [Chloroherpeton thalassium]ACF14645.1 ferredoxin [Chloroherpeton thalassium ATCC 35110]
MTVSTKKKDSEKTFQVKVIEHQNPNNPKVLSVLEGTTILEAMQENAIHLQHNCGGVCACSTCHVIIKEGMENLPEMTDEEEEQLDEAVGLTLTSRLGCQCKIYGDITVVIPDQSIYLGH